MSPMCFGHSAGFNAGVHKSIPGARLLERGGGGLCVCIFF